MPYNILAEVNYQFGYLIDRTTQVSDGKISKFSFLVGPEIFLNSSVGIEVILGYKYYKEKWDMINQNTSKSNGFYVAVGIQFHLEKR